MSKTGNAVIEEINRLADEFETDQVVATIYGRRRRTPEFEKQFQAWRAGCFNAYVFTPGEFDDPIAIFAGELLEDLDQDPPGIVINCRRPGAVPYRNPLRSALSEEIDRELAKGNEIPPSKCRECHLPGPIDFRGLCLDCTISESMSRGDCSCTWEAAPDPPARIPTTGEPYDRGGLARTGPGSADHSVRFLLGRLRAIGGLRAVFSEISSRATVLLEPDPARKVHYITTERQLSNRELAEFSESWLEAHGPDGPRVVVLPPECHTIGEIEDPWTVRFEEPEPPATFSIDRMEWVGADLTAEQIEDLKNAWQEYDDKADDQEPEPPDRFHFWESNQLIEEIKREINETEPDPDPRDARKDQLEAALKRSGEAVGREMRRRLNKRLLDELERGRAAESSRKMNLVEIAAIVAIVVLAGVAIWELIG